MAKKIDPTDRLVGTRVRLQRISMGISQTKLAEALGVTFQQVQKYENGSNRISASRLDQIARTLSVQPGFFFEGLVEVRSAATEEVNAVSDFVATAEGVRLMRGFLRISRASVRRSIIALVEDVAAAEAAEEGAS